MEKVLASDLFALFDNKHTENTQVHQVHEPPLFIYTAMQNHKIMLNNHHKWKLSKYLKM